jgi:response regulator of citrate/malate metabolism
MKGKMFDWLMGMGRPEAPKMETSRIKSEDMLELKSRKKVKKMAKKAKSARRPVRRVAKKRFKKAVRKPAKRISKKSMVVTFLKKKRSGSSISEVSRGVRITPLTARRYLFYLKKERKVNTKNGKWVAR